MISGTHPWAELNQMQALFQIGMGRKPTLPDEISNECRDFLEKTFELDYNNRPSADELLNHAFMGTEMTFPTPPPGSSAAANGDDATNGDAEGGEKGDTTAADATMDTTADGDTTTTKETKEKRPTRSKSMRRLEREKRHKEAAVAAAAARPIRQTHLLPRCTLQQPSRARRR